MNPYNILIVEDDVDIARAIEAYLNNQGYKTFMAGNGIEGFSKGKLTFKKILKIFKYGKA